MLIFVALGDQRHIVKVFVSSLNRNLENSNRGGEQWHSSLVHAISVRDIRYKCGVLFLFSVGHSRASIQIEQ